MKSSPLDIETFELIYISVMNSVPILVLYKNVIKYANGPGASGELLVMLIQLSISI